MYIFTGPGDNKLMPWLLVSMFGIVKVGDYCTILTMMGPRTFCLLSLKKL